MARRSSGLWDSNGLPKALTKIHTKSLDYHEGLSANQVKIILREFGLEHKLQQFNEWMFGQTCPIIHRGGAWDAATKEYVCKDVGGVYEYDLFRWINWQKGGATPIWD